MIRYKFIFLILFLSSFTLFSKAQIPVLKSNVPESEKPGALIYKNFSGLYDLVISCSEQSYWWEDKKIFKILAYKKGHWAKIWVSVKKKKNGIWSKPKIKLIKFDSNKADTIIPTFNKKDFWNLSNDSLQIVNRKIDDTTYQHFSVSDGINYKFEIMTRNDFLVIEAYMPEYFLSKIPEVKSRESFIKCKDLFLSVYAGK